MKIFNYVNDLPKLPELKTEEIDGIRFYNTPSGKLPSVTSVLGYFEQEPLDEWREKIGHEEADRISRKAADRGTKVHDLFEGYLRNHRHMNMMPDLKQIFNEAESTLDKIDNIHYIEARLYSTELGIAGRTDVIGEFDGKLSVIDFKTSLRAKKEEDIRKYFEQGTAYSLMYEELTNIPIDQIVVIILCDDAEEMIDGKMVPQVFVRNKYDYIDSLMQKIETYRKEELCF